MATTINRWAAVIYLLGVVAGLSAFAVSCSRPPAEGALAAPYGWAFTGLYLLGLVPEVIARRNRLFTSLALLACWGGALLIQIYAPHRH